MKKRALFIAGIVLIVAGVAIGAAGLFTGDSATTQYIPLSKNPTTKVERDNAANGQSDAAANAGEIQWLTSLDEAKKQSKKTGKPIFVDFYATWCPPCKMMDAQTYPDGQVISEAQKWIMVRIDTDKQTDVALQYGIQALPTLAVLQPDGKPVAGTGGFLDAQNLMDFLHEAEKKL